MVARLGRPCARFTVESGSRPYFLAQIPQTRATAGVESTRTPSISNNKARQEMRCMTPKSLAYLDDLAIVGTGLSLSHRRKPPTKAFSFVPARAPAGHFFSFLQ